MAASADPTARRSASSRAVRTIALFEALKGALVLLAGAGALSFVHRDVQGMAERLITHLHLDAAHHTPRIFLDFAANLTDERLARLAMLAAAYAALRFVEAYGLARERRWAEWLAAVSGGLYVPFEIEHLLRGNFWESLAALAVNLLVVGVMVHALLRHRRGESAAQAVVAEATGERAP